MTILDFWLRCGSALILVMGTFYVSFVIVRRVFPGENAPIQWCAQCVAGICLGTLGFHFLALLGWFSLVPALLSVAVMVAVCRLWGPSFVEVGTTVRDEAVSAFRSTMVEADRSHKLLLGFAAFMAVCLAARTLVLPPVAWDSLTYHAVKAGMWVQQGDLWLMDAPSQWSGYRGFPGGGEILWAWSVLPFHSDILMSFADFACWCFFFPALYSLSRTLGLAGLTSLAAAVFCAFVPGVFFAVGSGYVDNLLALSFTLAALFGLRFLSSYHPRDLVFTFLCLGIAGGIKYSAYLSMFLAGSAIAIDLVWNRMMSLRMAGWSAIAVAGMFVLTAPWWGYNIVQSGDPIHPFGKIPAGRNHSPEASTHVRTQPKTVVVTELGNEADRTSTVDRVRMWADDRVWPELSRLTTLFSNNPKMPPAYGLPSVIPILLFPFGFVGLLRANPRHAFFLLSLIAGFLILYYSPFSASIRSTWVYVSARLILTSFILMTVIGLYAVRHVPERSVATLLLFIPFIQTGARSLRDWRFFEAPYVLGLVFVAVLLWVIVRYSAGRLSWRAGIVVGVLGIVALLTVANWAKNEFRYRAYRDSFFFHNFPRYWATAASSVRNELPGTRIAVTSGRGSPEFHWFTYPFLGDRLRNRIRYIPTSRTEKSGSGPSETRADYRAWLNKLRLNRITHVMSFRPMSRELMWMRSHPDSFRVIDEGYGYGFFRVLHQGVRTTEVGSSGPSRSSQ